MEDLFLKSENFENRLNLSNFQNVEKSINEKELNRIHESEDFEAFEKSEINDFIKEVEIETGYPIKKGAFNDTEEVKNYIKKGVDFLSSLKKANVRNSNGDLREVFILRKSVKDEFKKAQENDLQKSMYGEDLVDVELESDVQRNSMSSLIYGSNSIKFTKSGRQIMEKIAEIGRELTSDFNKVEEAIDKQLEKCPKMPKEKCEMFDVKNCPYKVFGFKMMFFENNPSNVGLSNQSEDSSDCCNSEEEAMECRKYNELVGTWCNLKSEKQNVELYRNNLDVNINYDLTANQMRSLNF